MSTKKVRKYRAETAETDARSAPSRLRVGPRTPYDTGMALVSVQNVTKQFGTQVVLDGLSLDLHAGETVGLVGANGSGKTTLFRLIAGEIEPDLGDIIRTRNQAIGLLKQEPDICLTRTLHDEVASVFADLLHLEEKLHLLSEAMASCGDDQRLPQLMDNYERINARFISQGGHSMETRLNEILGGLGFSPEDFKLPMAVLSGGQKCRVALAKLLLQDRRLLLLDEPTNHLDIDAVRWLETYLANHDGAVILISHDRYLLDRLCTRVIELERGKASSFPGNYSNYAQTRERRDLTQQRQLEKDSEFIRKERAFIAKHMGSQRTKEAKGRRTRLERRLRHGEFVTDAPRRKRRLNLGFSSEKGKRARNTGLTEVLRCEGLAMRFDNNVLFTDLTFQGYAGQRLGITGPNGSGKTTLLKNMLGQTPPTDGMVTLDPDLTIGYYAQEHVALDPQRSVVEEIRENHPELSEQLARSMLGRFHFRGDDVFKPLGSLSGGEQSRVRLIKLILDRPDLLVLDEPTNHLDIPAREALEESLDEFDGTVIVVSHDRYFLDRVVDRLLVLRRDRHDLYDGNYSFYIEQVEKEREKRDAAPAKRRKSPKAPATAPRPRKGPSPYDRLSIDELEAMVIDREVQLAALQERFGDPAVCRDPDALAELKEQIDELTRELAEIDAAWHERTEHQ